ncbi:MAG TPA: phosphoribosyltransferase family protein [Thermoanaerobaculia bacterium]|nr:phosphoribosyltransferase family protein [Thermoanaerobaculia bacterium]
MAENDSVVPHYSEEEIAERVRLVGESIRSDAGSTPLILIAILKGSTVLLADLLRAIPGSVSYQFVDVIMGVADTEIAEARQLNFLTHFDMEGKNVYLLKDVVSTGVIESYLVSQFRQKRPAALKLVALLDRPGLRTVDLQVDFRVFDVGSGTFVGYGLEYGGEYGNLPFIGTIEKRG